MLLMEMILLHNSLDSCRLMRTPIFRDTTYEQLYNQCHLALSFIHRHYYEIRVCLCSPSSRPVAILANYTQWRTTAVPNYSTSRQSQFLSLVLNVPSRRLLSSSYLATYVFSNIRCLVSVLLKIAVDHMSHLVELCLKRCSLEFNTESCFSLS